MVEADNKVDTKNATGDAAATAADETKADDKQAEIIEDPMDESLALSTAWGLYEHYESAGNDYEMCTKKVAWFNDAISFA